MLDGVTTMAKVAHMRLYHSRMPFLQTYPREAHEMVFDAHEKEFAFFKGACQRGIYDNMKAAVDGVLITVSSMRDERDLREKMPDPKNLNRSGP